MNPKWQRARITNTSEDDPAWYQQSELWVECGPARVIGEGRVLAYRTNLVDRNHRVSKSGRVVARHDRLELLARSPDDFAEHVEPQDYDAWERACQATH